MFLNLVTEFLFQRYVVYGKKVDNRDRNTTDNETILTDDGDIAAADTIG